MTPVETLFIGLALVFGIIGVVRGFLKELGVTLVMVVTLFGLARLSNYMPKLLGTAASVLNTPINSWFDRPGVWLVFYLFVLIGVVFIAYQGYVIKYPGNDPRGAQGVLLGLMIGLINGYLIVGTAWHYIHLYQAPLRALGLIQGEYTPLAQRLIAVLPPDLLEPYLPFLIVFMLVLLVLK